MGLRFFVESPLGGETAELVGNQARHAASVMRLQPGDEVVLFDGRGAEFSARVTRLSRTSVELRLLDRREIDRELAFSLVLGVALPKGERQRWLVEKAVELGVSRLVPLITGRGVAQPVAAAIRRLRRAVIEASKQCGRNRLMEIGPPATFTDYLGQAPRDATRVAGHLKGELLTAVPAAGSSCFLAVGPEGGWTDDEIEQFGQYAWQAAALGPRVLRVETAAIAMVAYLSLGSGSPG